MFSKKTAVGELGIILLNGSKDFGKLVDWDLVAFERGEN